MWSSLVSHIPNISTYAFRRMWSTVENLFRMLLIFKDPVSRFVGCAFLCIFNRYKKSSTSSGLSSFRFYKNKIPSPYITRENFFVRETICSVTIGKSFSEIIVSVLRLSLLSVARRDWLVLVGFVAISNGLYSPISSYITGKHTEQKAVWNN